MRLKPIAITLGDPAGIGPEVVLKALRRLSAKDRSNVLIFGSRAALAPLNKSGLRLSPEVRFEDVTESALAMLSGRRNGKLSVVPGTVAKNHAAAALAAIDRACRLAQQGAVAAIVTAPVNKTAMRLVCRGFHGHTEYLAHAAHARHFAMMFVSDKLKVTLATIHVPLSKVSRLITQDLIREKVMLTHAFLKSKLKISRPRIAVCALNPHGSETGNEEARVMAPAVKALSRKGLRVTGPLSGDQVFYDAYRGDYDAVLSMYHDQGLAPFKLVAFHDGVNVTLGLPYIRTSPDHGTAYDIAGKGIADPRSMLSAIRWAQRFIAAP